MQRKSPAATIRGKRVCVGRDVYRPSDDTELLAQFVPHYAKGYALDMGTGCGIQAILAAGKAAKVLAVDINPFALECAKVNAKLNNAFSKIEFRLSDLFSAIPRSEKFDLIIFNPPYLPTSPSEAASGPIDAAWNGGRTGRKVISRFLRSFATHLKPRGALLMLHADLADTEKTVKVLESKGFRVRKITEIKAGNETLSVLLALRR